MIMVIII